jgi:O-antigen/teichoic acid export membrane protein
MVFVARLLGKETYGQFVVVQSTLSMVGVFAGFGIGTTATRYVAELRLRDSGRLAHILALTERSILAIGLIATLVLALMSGFIASRLLNASNLTLPLSIAAASILFSALDSYQKSILIGLEAMRAFAIGTIIGAAASVPLMLVLANMYGLNGVAGAIVLSTLIQSGISRVQVVSQLKRFTIRREAQGCLKEWRVLRDFALPALLGGILVAPVHWICQALLANTPNGYAELAVLGVAMQWFNVVIFLPNIAGRVLLPILTEHFANEDHGESAKALKLAIISNLAVVIPVALTIALISPWLMLAYGPQFRDGAQSLALVALVAILYVGALPVGHVLSAGGRMWLGATLNLGWAILFLGSAFFLVKHGAVGFIVAMGIAYLVHATWVGLYAARHLADLKTIQMNVAVIDAVK